MARYLLMNKNTPVLEFDYDLEVHAVMKILEVHDARYAPPSTVDQSYDNAGWQNAPTSRRNRSRHSRNLAADKCCRIDRNWPRCHLGNRDQICEFCHRKPTMLCHNLFLDQRHRRITAAKAEQSNLKEA